MRLLGGRDLGIVLLRLRSLLGRCGRRFGGRCRRFRLGFRRLGSLRFLRRLATDAQDAQDRELLPVTALAAVIVAAALLEHRHLLGLGLGDDFRRDGQAVRRAQVAPFAGEQDIAQLDGVASFARKLLDDDLVSGG